MESDANTPHIVGPREDEFPVYTVDLEFPAFILENVDENDCPLLTKIIMSLYAMSWSTIPAQVRMLTRVQLSQDQNEYTVCVRMPSASFIEFDAIYAMWSSTPLSVVAILIGHWVDTDTKRIYMNLNMIVRRTFAPLSGRFLMQMQYVRRMRIARSALGNMQNERRTMTLLRAADEEHQQTETTTERRTPWMALDNKMDRDVAHSIIMTCKDMCVGRDAHEFWDGITIQNNVAVNMERVVIQWRLPANSVIDAIMGATLRIRHPAAIESIVFRLETLSADLSDIRVALDITLFSAMSKTITMIDCTVTNLYSTQRIAHGKTTTVRVCGPSTDANGPVEIATAQIGDAASGTVQRKREREEEEDDDNDDDGGGVMEHKNKRARVDDGKSAEMATCFEVQTTKKKRPYRAHSKVREERSSSRSWIGSLFSSVFGSTDQ